MKFQAQQHLHDSQVSKQIQTILSPFVLPLLASLFVIVGYRTTLQGLNSLSLDDSISSIGSALVLKNSTQLSLNTNDWIPFGGLEDDIEGNQQDLYNSLFELSVNNTMAGYDSWRNNTITLFETALQIALDRYESQTQYVSKITALIQTLNDTVLDELVQKNSQLLAIQSEISDSLSVGTSIDVSELSVDTSGISDDFMTVFSGLSFANDTNLLGLNDSKEAILLSVDTIFEAALEKLEDYDFDLSSTVVSSHANDSLSLIHGSSSGSSYTSNGTSTSSSSSSSKGKSDPLKSTLITLGLIIFVAYIPISMLNHFHFQYASQLRKETYLHSHESTSIDASNSDNDDAFTIDGETSPDLEKNEQQLESNFNAMYHRLRDPAVTMITDSLSRYTGSWYTTYWGVEYLTLRLPLIVVCLVSACVVLIGVMKTGVDGDIMAVASQLDSNYTESFMTSEYTIEFPSFELHTRDVPQSVEDWNDFITDLHVNVSSSLDQLFDDHNITGVLSLDVPLSSPLSLLNLTYTPLSKTYTLPNISLSSKTSLQVTSTTSSLTIPSIVATLVTKAVDIVKKAVIQTCVISLCVLGGMSLVVLLIGFVYSLLLN